MSEVPCTPEPGRTPLHPAWIIPSSADGHRVGVTTQSKVVASLTLLVAITLLHRSGSVAVEPLHLGRLARSHESARLHSGHLVGFTGGPLPLWILYGKGIKLALFWQ